MRNLFDSALEAWLIRCAGYEAHIEGEADIMRLASKWRVRFRDARTGRWRTVHVPIKGNSPPPGLPRE